MADKKEVVIKLTQEQREQIKNATGKDLAELKVGTVEDRANPLSGGAELAERSNPFGDDPTELASRSNPFGDDPSDLVR
jgi:hypothetical protein